MNHTLRSVIEEELQKAYERGVQDGMKQERALWRLAEIGQEIELGISYEEANPPEPYCQRCGKKLGTEATDIHTCTPKEIQPVAWVVYENGEKHGLDFDEDDIAKLPVGTMLYTAPQKKEWVGLTERETIELALNAFALPEVSLETRIQLQRELVNAMNESDSRMMVFAASIEAKLKEKNG